MDKNELVELRKEFTSLPKDRYEVQKDNKDKIIKIRAKTSIDVASGVLDKLLYLKQHYFDEGFKCKHTPEELNELIEAEIDRLIDV
jgi:hypothetical protein